MCEANQAARVQFGPPLCTKTAGGRALPPECTGKLEKFSMLPKPFAGKGVPLHKR